MRRRRLPCWTHSFVMFRHVSSPSCWVFKLEAEYLWHPVYSLCVEYEVLRSACQGLDFPKVMFQKIAERQLGICTGVLSIIAILCYFVLFHTVLFHDISYYVILFHIISYYSMLQYMFNYFMLCHALSHYCVLSMSRSILSWLWMGWYMSRRWQVDSLYRKKCAPWVSSASCCRIPASSQSSPRCCTMSH